MAQEIWLHKVKHFHLVLVFLLIGWILVACEPQARHLNISDNPLCKPPCWEMITPGITTKDEALAILSTLKTINQPVNETEIQMAGQRYDVITFTLFENYSGVGDLYILNNQITLIDLGARWDITVQEAIDAYGTPQSILAEREGEFEAISMFYPQLGLDFSRRFSQGPSDVRPDNQIYNATFFDPIQYQMLLNSGFFHYSNISVDEVMKRLHPWEGYKTIDYYLSTSDQ